jgi:hypothetical protein
MNTARFEYRRSTGYLMTPADRRDVSKEAITMFDTLSALARQEWNRLAGMPSAARAALVADTVWNREYGPAYRTAYATAASRIAAAATQAAAANPNAWLTLHQLAAAAGEAISRLEPQHPAAPPADRRTVTDAQVHFLEPDQQPSWRRVATIAAAGARRAGTQAGTLTAATDILTGWRGRSGHALAEGGVVHGKPVRAWVGELLATVNREIATRAGAIPRRTAARLAREDHAPSVPSTTAGAVRSRIQRPASPTGTQPTMRSR